MLFRSCLAVVIMIFAILWRRSVKTCALVLFFRSAAAAVGFLPGQSGPGGGAGEDQALGRELAGLR